MSRQKPGPSLLKQRKKERLKEQEKRREKSFKNIGEVLDIYNVKGHIGQSVCVYAREIYGSFTPNISRYIFVQTAL